MSVVYAPMVDWQLKVRMAWPGPFYTGTSCLNPVSNKHESDMNKQFLQALKCPVHVINASDFRSENLRVVPPIATATACCVFRDCLRNPVFLIGA